MTSFDDLTRQYRKLKAQQQANRISFETFVQSVHRLRLKDASDHWWQIDPQTGQWMTWDGSAWVNAEREPVEDTVKKTEVRYCEKCKAQVGSKSEFCTSCGHRLKPREQTAHEPQDKPSTDKTGGIREKLLRYNQKTWDKISILGGGAMGALWLGYTTKEGADLLSGCSMAILPLLLVVLRPKIDRLLMPLQKIRRRLPKGVLLGLGLAVPLFVSNFLYHGVFGGSTSGDEYLYMFLTFIISVVVSYVIIRDPVASESLKRN